MYGLIVRALSMLGALAWRASGLCRNGSRAHLRWLGLAMESQSVSMVLDELWRTGAWRYSDTDVVCWPPRHHEVLD